MVSYMYVMLLFGCIGLSCTSSNTNHKPALILGNIYCQDFRDCSIPIILQLFDERGVLKWRDSCTSNKEGEYAFRVSKAIIDDCWGCIGEVLVGTHKHTFRMDAQVIKLEPTTGGLGYSDYISAYCNYLTLVQAYYLGVLVLIFAFFFIKRHLNQKYSFVSTREQRERVAKEQQELLMRQPNVLSTTMVVE